MVVRYDQRDIDMLLDNNDSKIPYEVSQALGDLFHKTDPQGPRSVHTAAEACDPIRFRHLPAANSRIARPRR